MLRRGKDVHRCKERSEEKKNDQQRERQRDEKKRTSLVRCSNNTSLYSLHEAPGGPVAAFTHEIIRAWKLDNTSRGPSDRIGVVRRSFR